MIAVITITPHVYAEFALENALRYTNFSPGFINRIGTKPGI